jgi:signal recognition particle receptor subunit beta
VTLTGTEFVKGANVAVSGTAVNVGKVTWLSKTSMTVVLNVTNKAATRPRTITVTNPDFGSGTLTNGLTVT